MSRRRNYLILGGAGFVGSHIAKKACEAGNRVMVVDGLVKGTGGSADNLRPYLSDIRFVNSTVEKFGEIVDWAGRSDLIIDCMAWTSHWGALEDPFRDMRLNLQSHLYFLSKIKKCRNKRIIYLGSRGQYGNHGAREIRESTPMVPEDIQGVHKTAAESYYRIYAKLCGFHVISLRFPNCFGENQPTSGKDIGLIGSFIRGILLGSRIAVYGLRSRNLVYVRDLSEVVMRLCDHPFKGFLALNYGGQRVAVKKLVKTLIRIAGKGSFAMRPVPERVKAIDIGSADFSDSRLRTILGGLPGTDLDIALGNTVAYFKERLL